MRLAPALAAIGLIAFHSSAFADNAVSRTPPPIYAGHLAAQLTPLAEVLPGRTAFPETKAGGVNLLFEKVVYREAGGPTYRLMHVVYHALDQSGVESIGSDTFTFDREREDIFVIDAATILPDGRRQPVESQGLFIQTPQRQADQSLYTSDAELRIVYPNTSAGACTEAIVLVRERVPVMPGHFALDHTYGSNWPTYRDRLTLDFPAADLRRMQASITGGAGVPEPKTEAYAAGRERRTWQASRVAEVAWEESGPRWEYRAPTLWLTTVESWDALAAWYGGLVASRSELGPELAAKVEALTAGLKDPRAVIDRLTEVVATDVRYVGLEFGLAGYQPHHCAEVWAQRYGDCKDKANLLRAMLAHKGIRSHLVLLDTRGMGRVHRASPSWLQFNHVILAIEAGAPGEYVYCDPTVERLPAGELGMRDLAREILILRDGRAEWAQTRDELKSGIHVTAELTLADNGALSGWFSLAGSGTDAAYYADYFHGLDRDDRRRKMQEYAEGFIAGSEVMDVEFAPPAPTVRESRIRAYLVRPPRSTGEQVLNFPYPTSWLPGVSTQGDRRFPYATNRRVESVEVTIAFPASWSVRTAPTAFSASSATASFAAGWTVQPGKLIASLTWSPARAVLAPAEYPVFQRSVRALSSWLSQPLVLTPAAAEPAVAAGPGADLNDFPVLPTGEGQMRLLEEKYPEGANDTARRAALQRVLQWFPQDAETVFIAQMKLLLLDQAKLGDAEFCAQARALLGRQGPGLSRGLRAWSEYLEARARWKATRDPAALARLEAIADDVSLGAFRRGWSAHAAGQALRDTDHQAAKAFLLRHDDYESEAREAIVRLLAGIYAQDADVAGFTAWTKGLANELPHAADALLQAATDELVSITPAPAARAQFVQGLRSVIGDGSGFPRTHERLQAAEGMERAEAARRQFRTDVGAWLQQHPPGWWTPRKSAEFADTAALIKHIRAANDAEKAEVVVDDALQLALHHEPAFADFAVYTRWALWWLDHRNLQDDLFDVIGAATLQLPPAAHEDVIDCWNLVAMHEARRDHPAAARALFQRVLAEPAAAKYQQVEAGGELGLLELRGGNATAALTAFQRIQPLVTEHKRGTDYIYVATLLRLARGEFDQALAGLAAMQRQEQRYLDSSKHHVAVAHLLRAAQRPDALKRYWARRAGFQAAWTAILSANGLGATPDDQPPLETDYAALQDRIAKALAAKDVKTYLRELDQFARLAQWIPLFSSDFISHTTDADELSGPLQRQLYECGLLLVQDAEPVDPNYVPPARVWDAALTGDLGRKAEACRKARNALQEVGLEVPDGERLLRLWVIFARGSADDADATARLARELAGPRVFQDRLRSVGVLSDSYQQSGDPAVHLALLEREVQRADFNRESATARTLLARLDTLRAAGKSAQAITRAVTEWQQQRDLDWLPHVPPTALDDARFAALKPPVVRPVEGFTTAELIKFNLLAAADERFTPDVRGQSLYAAALSLALGADTIDEFSATLTGVARFDCLANEWRASALVVVLNGVLRNGYRQEAAEVAAAPAFQTIREDLRADYLRAQQALGLAAARGGDWLPQFVTVLAAKPAERFSVGVLEYTVRQLALRGEYDAAERLITAAERIPIDPGLQQSSSALRFEWLRLVRSIREREPLYAWLRDRLEKMPGLTAAQTPRVRRHFVLGNLAGLSDAERLALAEHFLTQGVLLPEFTESLLWVIGGARGFALKHPMFFPELAEMMLRSDAPDGVKSEAVGVAALASDVDQPEVRRRVTALLDEFAASSSAATLPRTRQAVALAQAVHALRTSREPRPAALFDERRTAVLPVTVRQGLQLRFHHSRGHTSEAMQLLDAADASSFTDPELFLVVRSLLAGAHRTAEQALLDESMLAVLQQRGRDFWRAPDEVRSEHWFEVADVLRVGGKVFPPAWFERAVARSGNEERRHMLRARQAWLARDWARTRDAADQALRAAPDVYDNYYLRALARQETGDLRGAGDDLQLFLQFSLSSLHYPDAAERLRQLQPGEKLDLPQ
jgi:hypothetical protein